MVHITHSIDRQTLDKVREMMGDPEEFRSRFEAAERNQAAFNDQYKTLLTKHPNQWICFYGQNVKAVAPTRDQLLRRVDELGLPRGDVIMRFMRTTPRKLIL